MKKLLFLLLLGGIAAAQPAIIPGTLGFDSNDLAQAIEAPPSVKAGENFQITVITSGDGCVSQGDTSVVLGENSADVFVYDQTVATEPGVICTRILKQFRHPATLRFTQKGEAVIRVWGKKQSGDGALGSPTVVEKRVQVR
jgi:hypothetical protein